VDNATFRIVRLLDCPAVSGQELSSPIKALPPEAAKSGGGSLRPGVLVHAVILLGAVAFGLQPVKLGPKLFHRGHGPRLAPVAVGIVGGSLGGLLAGVLGCPGFVRGLRP